MSEKLQHIEKRITTIPTRRRIWRRYVVAASVAALLAVTGWSDVKPGGNKVVLTLPNGSIVVLDSMRSGMVAQQGSTRIVKLDNGQPVYKAVNESSGEITYNTLTTPAAGQFQVALLNGSKVWLNNTSSLRCPVAFKGKTREVELKEHAWMESSPGRMDYFTLNVLT